ncbi:unnamed protein product, partial [Rotaria magnacalcarata]
HYQINFFSQQTDAALQRHIRSNGELKQQHKVLLSTLLLEQRLHSTATNEHKRLVKEKIEELQSAEHEWKSTTKNGQQRTDKISYY